GSSGLTSRSCSAPAITTGWDRRPLRSSRSKRVSRSRSTSTRSAASSAKRWSPRSLPRDARSSGCTRSGRMIALVALVALVVFAWRGAGPLALALLTAGFVLALVLSLRVLRASVGGVGGHAEWVRDVSTRPRLARSPGWAVALAATLAGVALALFERC